MIRNIASLLLVAALATAPAGLLAKSSDRNQTLNVESDKSDCTMVDGAPCILTGNVRITQGTLDIQSARADFTIADGEIRKANLTGSPVHLKQELDSGSTMNANASRIDYDLAQDTIVLIGNASVQQPGSGSIAGERIVYNTRTGQVQGGGDGSRVRMKFEPRNRTPASAPATDEQP